ncbi:MAG: hypothetical protein AAB332_03680 [Planctomycetota bacterium]
MVEKRWNIKNNKWGYTINLCVFVALCEEIERLSFPTRSGYGLDHVVVAEDL